MEYKGKGIREAFVKFEKDVDSSDLIACLNSKRDSWFEHRKLEHDKRWIENLRFYKGDHYNEAVSRLQQSYRVRVKENHMNNIASRILSIIVQHMPIPRVFASSDDWVDADKAEATEIYSKYFWRKKKLEKLFTKLVKNSIVFGPAFIHTYFDPNAGGVMALDSNESESGEQEEAVYRGDIDLCVDTPFNYLVPPGYEEWDDMPEYIRISNVSREFIENKYGMSVADQQSLKIWDATRGEIMQSDSHVLLSEYFFPPCDMFEKGIYAAWVGGKLLRAHKFPYKHGKKPSLYLGFDDIPMQFWAQTSLDQIIDLQQQLNKASSMIIEARNLVARPRVLASNQAQIAAQSITDRPGDIVRYNLVGGKPEFVVPSFNFGELGAQKADVRNTMGALSGITSASRNEIPSSVKTALALQLVLEQDRSQFLPFIKNFHQVILDTMYNVLGMAAQYFPEDDPRFIKVEHGGLEVSKAFHGGMVPDPLDIYLEDTNPLGWTAAGRAQTIVELVQAGVIDDKNKALEMLKLGYPDPAFELLSISKKAAVKENELLMKGKVVEVIPGEDSAAHLEEHKKLRLTFNYRKFPDAVRKAIDYHIAKTEEAMGAGQVPGEGEMAKKSPNPNDISGQLESPEPSLNQLLEEG